MKQAPSSRPTRASGLANRRVRRKLQTRQALLDAGHSLLASRSIDALSVDEIAMSADVGKGTFYNYFADKDELTRELAAQVRMYLTDEISKTNEGVADPALRIARAFCWVLRFGFSDPRRAAALMRLFPHAMDPEAPFNVGVRKDVATGLARGRIVAPTEDIAIAAIVGVCIAGLNRVVELSPSLAREFAGQLGTLLLHGLGLSRAEAGRILRTATKSIFDRKKEQ